MNSKEKQALIGREQLKVVVGEKPEEVLGQSTGLAQDKGANDGNAGKGAEKPSEQEEKAEKGVKRRTILLNALPPTKVIMKKARGQWVPTTVHANYKQNVNPLFKVLPHHVTRRMRREEKYPGRPMRYRPRNSLEDDDEFDPENFV